MPDQQPPTLTPHSLPLVPAEVLERVAKMRPAGAEVLLVRHFPPALVRKLLRGWCGEFPPEGALRGALVSAVMTEQHQQERAAAQAAKTAYAQRRNARRKSEQ